MEKCDHHKDLFYIIIGIRQLLTVTVVEFTLPHTPPYCVC